MISALINLALKEWGRVADGRPPPLDPSWLVQSRNRVIIFLFDRAGTDESPSLVIKMARSPDDNAQIERCAETAATVRQRLSPPLLYTVPETHLLGRVGGLSCIAQEPLRGEPIALSRRALLPVRRDEPSVMAFRCWLTQFQEATHSHVALMDTDLHVESLASLLDNPNMRNVLGAHLSTQRGIVVPFCWRCGDVHHSNILMSHGSVSGFVDWDGAQDSQPAYLDWVQFVFEYARATSALRHMGRPRDYHAASAVRALLGPPNERTAQSLQRQSREYVASIGASWAQWPSLVLAFLDGYWWRGDKAVLVKEAVACLEEAHASH